MENVYKEFQIGRFTVLNMSVGVGAIMALVRGNTAPALKPKNDVVPPCKL
jgi:hypothetical protein